MTRQSIFNSWTTRLAEAIATAVRELAPRVTDESIAVLAVDGHPWHGAIYLAMLTGGELAEDEQLAQPSEMAAWRYYDFAGQLKAKRLFVPLGETSNPTTSQRSSSQFSRRVQSR